MDRGAAPQFHRRLRASHRRRGSPHRRAHARRVRAARPCARRSRLRGPAGFGHLRQSASPAHVAHDGHVPLLTNRGGSVEGSRPMATPSRGFREAGTPVTNSPRGESTAVRRVPAAGTNSPRGESAIERTVPSRPMTRSERPVVTESPRADVSQPQYSRAVPRSGTDHPVYQPRAAEPIRGRNDSPASDASVYRPQDGYRARPETYSPGAVGGRAVPRGDSGRPAAPSVPALPRPMAPPPLTAAVPDPRAEAVSARARRRRSRRPLRVARTRRRVATFARRGLASNQRRALPRNRPSARGRVAPRCNAECGILNAE